MKIRRLNRREKTEFVLDYYAAGKRVRRWFKTKAMAEVEVDALKEQKRTCGETWVDLAPAVRSDLMLLVDEAKREGITLRQLWEAFRSGKLDAAPLKQRTLRQAIDETIAAKEADKCRDRYVRELGNYLERFAAGRGAVLVNRIGVAEIDGWFDSRKEAPATRSSNLGRLGAMFDLCWRRGYITENPCLKASKPKLDEGAPIILTPNQAKQLLVNCSPAMLPYLTLGMLAGIRPDELQKICYRDIDLKAGTVTVEAAASKTRRRRIVPLVHHIDVVTKNKAGKEKKELKRIDTGLQWLKKCSLGNPDEPIAPAGLRALREGLSAAAGVEWQHDLLRHSAASYLLALVGDAGKVANILGNSARILERRYKQIVTAENCRAFWALTPNDCGKELAS